MERNPEGTVRTLRCDSYLLFSYQEENMVQHQRLAATVRHELHEPSQWPGKAATCHDFKNHLEAQDATWQEQLELKMRVYGEASLRCRNQEGEGA